MENNYEKLAKYYDEINNDTIDYNLWLSIVNQYINKNDKILDIACGTGKLTNLIYNLGYKIEGQDLSEEMINYAKVKYHEINFEQKNMLYMDQKKYNAITCFTDSINYILDKEKINQIFSNVYEKLEENGIFIFDVHSIDYLNNILDGYYYHEFKNQYMYTWNSELIEKNKIKHRFNFFIKDINNEYYEHYQEEHIQKTYSIKDYKNLLKLNKFDNIKIYEVENRIFIIAKK